MSRMKQLFVARTQANSFRGLQVLVLAGMLAAASLQAPASQAQNPPPDLSAPGFQEFSDRVQKYVQLHKSVEATLPKLKSTNEPELIEAHQKMLARKIKAARIHAKRGDIFTPAATEAFKKAMSTEFQGPHAPHAQATMTQGAPLKQVHLRVNQIYPENVPYTSVPPTLLQKLPKLPDEVAYRAVSSDLVLLDVKTNLVLDALTGVIPTPATDHQ
ncbi:MAG: hypothetical protein M3P45_03735 [Acidobacteriota bacterium]|nr:hypothetical protein [Acidobacteriota bacterium]